MSVLMGRGEQAKKALEGGSNIDLKNLFIRLKSGQSRKVRILTPYDYVAYKAHGHFAKGVYTQPCIKVAGERCLLCEAANYDGDLVETDDNGKSVWNSMYAKKRVLFAFVDLEEDEIRIFDATKSQADGLIATIDEYADELDSVAFTFKRTGDRQETTYSLNPIMPKRMKEVQEVFDKWDDKEVPDELFEEAAQARTTEQQAKELKQAGFPVEEALGFKVAEDDTADEDKGEPITEEDDPTNDF
jgi:hypothetical protein